MSKQYKVLVNTAKKSDNLVLDVPRQTGAELEPLRIKAKAGQKYQLQEMPLNPAEKPFAPDYIKVRRLGKNLLVSFEGEEYASVIIEDYYEVFTESFNGLVGQA